MKHLFPPAQRYSSNNRDQKFSMRCRYDPHAVSVYSIVTRLPCASLQTSLQARPCADTGRTVFPVELKMLGH